MKLIIISAGSATRLGRHTSKIPKGLLKINGISILERQVKLFLKKQINEIIIITGPHKEKYDIKNVQYLEDKEHEDHDVLQSLMVSEKQFSGEIITSYSDIIFEEKIIDQIIDSKGDIQVVTDLDWEKNYDGRTEHPKTQADNVVIEEGKIIKIKKDISSVEKNQTLGEFIGILKFSQKGSKIFLDAYDRLKNTHTGNFQNAPSFQKAYLTDILQELVDNGIRITPIIINGRWCEIDTPQDLKTAEKMFENKL